MKNQALFSSKDKIKKIKMSSAAIFCLALHHKRQQNLKNVLFKHYKEYRAVSVDSDEVAHDEPPHLNLHCLQIQLFSYLELKGLNGLHAKDLYATKR